MAEYIKILKPKTRPVQLEPWFQRYLTFGQLKVLGAIVAHADYATRTKDSFASNKTLAWYAGFGLINENSKDYKYYQTLSDEEKKIEKKKKKKNAAQTVKNIKKQLEDLGVIKREVQGTKSYVVVDLDWGKERYLREFNEEFNETELEHNDAEDEITSELENLSRLSGEGNISKENLAKQLEALSDKLVPKDNTKDLDVHRDDIDKLTEHIMTSKSILDKISQGKIKNEYGYRNTVKKQIQNNTFNGAKDYYYGLVAKEKNQMLDILKSTCFEKEEQNQILECDRLFIDEDTNIILAHYKSKTTTFEKNFAIPPNIINDVLTLEDYTKVNQNYITNYLENYQKAYQSEVQNE